MADWGKPFLTSFRFMRVDRASGNEVERITNIKNGGCIERNQDKDYTTGQVDYSGALDIGADLLRVYLDADFGGASVSEALGTFVVSAPKRTRRGVNSTGTAGLSGRLSEVAEDEFDAPFTVAAGTVVVPYVVKLLKAAGFADVIADGSDYKLAQDWTLGIDSGDMRLSKRLAACNALLDVAGFRAVDEDAYGRPVLRRYREPQDRPVSMTLREGSGARFINEVVDELDRSGVANVVHCDYETQDAFYRGTAIDSDPSSPYSTVSRGWRKTATYGYSDLPDGSTDAERQRNADAKANEMLRTQQSAIRRVTVKRTYAPIACGDAVMVDWASAGISGKFAVRTATLTLVGGCPIEMEVKRYER